ncbi:hypothetical protein [Serratia ficaria]|uniref:hypothetical protein n=1 Tax=Serratia ficaria TaxID=61651 RepID=UPI00217AD3AB|nr:hypothetical protein [Serratia ficaria]CAI0815944.1 Uncharacterised protein [Serratia ficaria]CAI1680607.1 Uncharacterised protein [Serratia ficaria]CAI1739065.1 Uncharacterised protein [Serratia ficaria]CAI2499909.1 Uncharacterised protein [Serratia ficaria]CAI2509638.1 Uncharacterised protein [Serratia ficaria]
MATYRFFVKGDRVEVRDAAAAEFEQDKRRLLASGHREQFEVLTASSAAAALARFKDIKREEQHAGHGFTTGAVFTSLLAAVLKKD